ncbi:response regulator transcription factor [Gorillibacterium sp. sgz500922]|uniref:response regulator transcription factor n=1 Tax=Gorillibacterium sp. sgz500922 TaxID=3446694 RepID=UPI003F665ED3
MYKVMIVDDEPIIRTGIRASVNWEAAGLTMIGDYSNGAEAMEALRRERADILITDIKMPLMDGLELTRRAMELHPGLKVILMSNYNDFHYVRQGIVLGAMDYILKLTLEPEELVAVLERCAEAIERERQGASGSAGWHRQLLLADRKNAERELAERLRSGSLDGGTSFLPDAFQNGCTLAALVIDHSDELKQGNGYLYLSLMAEDIKQRFYQRYETGVAVATRENELLLLIPVAYALPNEWKESLEKATGLRLTIGYRGGADAEWLGSAIRELEEFRVCRFYEGTGAIYRIGEKRPPRPAVSLPAELLDDGPAELRQILERKVAEWSSGQMEPERVKQAACEVFSQLFLKELEPKLVLEYYRDLTNAETLQELVARLAAAIRECAAGRSEDGKPGSARQIIEKAEEYLARHYTEEITLQRIADHVHVSKNYFSFLYKKHTNHNFIDRLIHLRIERAKELLRASELKVYEVAEQSGFNDVKYFSKLFKKLTGFSPVEYRNEPGQADEGLPRT